MIKIIIGNMCLFVCQAQFAGQTIQTVSRCFANLNIQSLPS